MDHANFFSAFCSYMSCLNQSPAIVVNQIRIISQFLGCWSSVQDSTTYKVIRFYYSINVTS